MTNIILATAFGLLSAINWLGSFVAIFPLLGMMTNANGFLSGGATDMMVLAALASLPICAVASAILYKFAGRRLPGVLVAAIPAAMGFVFLTV